MTLVNDSARRLACLLSVSAAVAAASSARADDAAGPAPAAPEHPTTLKHPPVDLSKGKTLYLVGYAHLDTQWRWAYPQVIREFIANTLHNNFELFEKYPDYVFNFSGSRRYEMMKEYYPEDYAEAEGVRQGRAGGSPAGRRSTRAMPTCRRPSRWSGTCCTATIFSAASSASPARSSCCRTASASRTRLPTVLAHCGIQGFSTQKLTWGSAVGIPFKVGVWRARTAQASWRRWTPAATARSSART